MRKSWRDNLRAFVRGAGTIFEIMPGGASTLYRPPVKGGPEDDKRALAADAAALAGDWRAVGDDLRVVMGDADAALEKTLEEEPTPAAQP